MSIQMPQSATENGKSRVTISDMATALNLTKSTVSRALNGYPDISAATQLRVARMAEKLNYRPLSHAQAIKTGRTRSLGLVLQLSDHDAQRPFLAEFLSGLSQGASAHGWTITLAATDSPANTTETFRTMVRDRKVDGFILPRTQLGDPRVALLKEADVPFVMFGRLPDSDGCSWFDVRGEEAMERAVEHLAALGHSRIGFINGGMQFTYGPLRRDGFLRGMAAAGLEADPAQMCENAMTRQGGALRAHDLLTQAKPPTAIVCAVDMAALGVYRAAAGLGLTIGRDLSVISYDGVPDGAHETPALTTFAVDFTASGHRLSEMLIDRIKGIPPEELRETVAATFLDRGSAGPPRLTSENLAAHVKRQTP